MHEPMMVGFCRLPEFRPYLAQAGITRRVLPRQHSALASSDKGKHLERCDATASAQTVGAMPACTSGPIDATGTPSGSGSRSPR